MPERGTRTRRELRIPLHRALHGHAPTAGAHLDLPSSESFSWAASACSSSERDTGGQRSRTWAGLSLAPQNTGWCGCPTLHTLPPSPLSLCPGLSSCTCCSLPSSASSHLSIPHSPAYSTTASHPPGQLLWATPPHPSLTSTTVGATQHHCSAQ